MVSRRMATHILLGRSSGQGPWDGALCRGEGLGGLFGWQDMVVRGKAMGPLADEAPFAGSLSCPTWTHGCRMGPRHCWKDAQQPR